MTGEKPQLKMVWPEAKSDQRPSVSVPDVYQIRQCFPNDQTSFLTLMSACGWEFSEDRLAYCQSRLLPHGWFAVTPTESTQIVASAMSLHNYSGRSMFSGTLGWVGCLPEHRGKRLGAVVTAAATSRLLEAGYTDVELYTEHFRHPAIAIYFQLGYVPYIYNDAVKQVWREVCEQIGREFSPDVWPHGENAYPSI